MKNIKITKNIIFKTKKYKKIIPQRININKISIYNNETIN